MKMMINKQEAEKFRLSFYLARRHGPRRRVFCIIGNLAQFFHVNFSDYAYCNLPIMCYTIITEGDERAKTFGEIVGYVIQLRVSKQLDKVVTDMKITPDGNSQKKKKSS